MKKIFQEFKTFISRGSIMDLAIAFIIGAAFKAIINSLVKDILTPIISLVIGDQGFVNYKYVITEADELNGIAENAIYYGNFIQNIFDFLIVAIVIFLIVKAINKASEMAKKAQEEAAEEITEVFEDVKPKMEEILTDIKGLLKDTLSIGKKD